MSPALVLALSLLCAPAQAADVDAFTPSGSQAFGHGSPQGEAGLAGGDGPSGSLVSAIASDLLRYAATDGSVYPMVRSAVSTTAIVGYGWGERLRLEGVLPFYPHVDAPWTEFGGPALGDVRVQAHVHLIELGEEAFGLAVVPRLMAPTGAADAFVARGPTGGALVAASGQRGAVGWLVNAGLMGSPASEVEGITLGSTADALISAWISPTERWRAGLEADARLGLAVGAGERSRVLSSHAFVQALSEEGVGLSVGAGAGLNRGAGAPAYRVLAAISYANTVSDRDADGLADEVDGCPYDAEDLDGFEDADGCPDVDNDADGLVDTDDLCPVAPEDLDAHEDADGCPDPDNDGDGVLDAEDACPRQHGTLSLAGCPDSDADGLADAEDACPGSAGPASAGGCPDGDGDGVPDTRDACPEQPIPADADPASSDGCPQRVYLGAESVEIAEKVEFALGSSAIRPVSHALLDEVVVLLRAHPELRQVEIAGHTDNQGGEAANLRLSAARAAAVRDYLVAAGIAAERLESKGYGETRPIDTNRTSSGRANNRRVEFQVLERADGTAPAPTTEPTGEDAPQPWTVPEPSSTQERPAASDSPAPWSEAGELPPETRRPEDEEQPWSVEDGS